MSETGSESRGPRPARRHAGWAALVGVLGIACLVIGLVLVAMIQAPAVRHQVIVTAYAFIIAGILLIPLAWLGRYRQEPEGQTANQTEPGQWQQRWEQDADGLAAVPVSLVHLTPENGQKLAALARQTGKTGDQLVNEAVERMTGESTRASGE